MIEQKCESEYLSAPLTKSNFIEILENISSSDESFDCSKQAFGEAYDKIKQSNEIVIGKDLYSFAQYLKEQSVDQVNQQLGFFETKILSMQKEGVKAIKKQQFKNMFNNQHHVSKKFTKMLQQKLQGQSCISLEKFLRLVRQVRRVYEDQGTLAIRRSANITKSGIFLQNSELQNPLQSILQMCKQYVFDLPAFDKIELLVHVAQDKVQEASSQRSYLKELGDQSKELAKELQEQLLEKDQLLDEKIQKLQQLAEKVLVLNEQKQGAEKLSLNLKLQVNKLKYENQVLNQQVSCLETQIQQDNQRIEAFMKDRDTVVKQFEEFIKQNEEEKEKGKTQQTQKIFVQRTLKQRLQDANMKINRLIEEKKTIQDEMTDMQIRYQARIQNLETQLQQSEKKCVSDKSMKRLNLSRLTDYQPSNSRSSPFNSSYHNGDQIIDCLIDKISDQSFAKSKRDKSVYENQSIRQVAESVHRSHSKVNFKKKKLEQSIFESIATCIEKESQGEDSVLINDFVGLIIQKEIFNATDLVNRISSQSGFAKGIFTSIASIVKDHGNLFEISIAVNSQRFYILDTKYREKQSFNLEDIEKIIICYANEDWILLKLRKDVKKPDRKQHRDTVIALPNRIELIRYLAENCNIKLSGAKIHFTKEEKTKVHLESSQMKLSEFHDALNPYRLCMLNSFSVFTVKMQEKSMISFSYLANEYLVIVQAIGILFFVSEGGSHNLLKNKELHDILPIVEDMTATIYGENNSKIRIKYKHYKKEYKLTTNCIATSRKIVQEIQEVKRVNLILKMQRLKRAKELFPKQMTSQNPDDIFA